MRVKVLTGDVGTFFYIIVLGTTFEHLEL
ncbi:conserved hypothetical protein [Xenorhabdus nematophila F1]|uniref:Uncharacterized protein n=1 Tax=Xenorhabdus nematophila (strain ATCC 19061 / DSM 3370 / CCUG 14189 / LMG 1036 / NCIMB 9965 / AN6) TaxID=406817 RepID=D3VI32_XENNA|nr:conserved hypothetical protein [Xenorhabdus nematophila ATCC 19061]CCW29426.1 conserved hypothetical protein [Xenorhabdus nematophila F1]